MCGRFSLGTPASILAAQFDLFEAPPWTPRYNLAPAQEVLVVVPLGSHSAVGGGASRRLPSDQRSRRDRGNQAGFPPRIP
jgi:putative SOS response-associated peptidase YedK